MNSRGEPAYPGPQFGIGAPKSLPLIRDVIPVRSVAEAKQTHKRTRTFLDCTWVTAAFRNMPEASTSFAVDWQIDIVKAHPQRLLRGLIHSNGCRVLNRVNGTGYPRYQFTNNSVDIREIFCDACDEFGVQKEAIELEDDLGCSAGVCG